MLWGPWGDRAGGFIYGALCWGVSAEGTDGVPLLVRHLCWGHSERTHESTMLE